MTTRLLISQRVIREFETRLNEILAAAPRGIELLPFTTKLEPSLEEIDTIEAAYYSRDVWEGTVQDTLSDAARAFWNIVERAPKLKWMAVYSAGMDQQRYRDAMRRGVLMTSSAGAQSESVGLAAAISVLTLARGIPYWIAAKARREWAPLRGKDVQPDIPGQTAVIIGTGYIGTVIARVLKAAGMSIMGIRRTPSEQENFDRVLPPSALDSVLAGCDWLVIACPLTPETRNLVDARRLALMKPSAGIANIARGEIIDEAALIDALQHKRLKHAYLDVFTTEPLPVHSPLWDLPQVILSPHNAGASTGTYARGVEIFLRNLAHYLSGRKLENEAVADRD